MTEIFSKNGVSLERMQTLAKVVRAGSIALAAKGDPNAQSLISRQLGELEKTLGLELLKRAKKPYQPTPAARRLAECCERFVREVGDVSAEAGGRSRPLKVGAGEWVIRELLIPLIDRRTKQWEGISWVMHNLTSNRIQVGLAAAAGWAVFVPELGWKRRSDWAARQQKLPGLETYRHTLHLGWNERVSQRRPEGAKLVKALGGMK